MTHRSQQLDFLLGLFRPWLTTVESAFLLDNCTEHHVRDLLDEGALRGVDISTPGASRRELRIYRYSVEHRLLAPSSPLTHIGPDQIIPHHRPTILRRELAAWLACTEQHISNLSLSGPGRDRHDARHIIHRESAVKWLEEREIL